MCSFFEFSLLGLLFYDYLQKKLQSQFDIQKKMIRSIDEAIIDFERTYRQVIRDPSQQTQEYCRRQTMVTYATVGAQYFQQLIQMNQNQFDLAQEINKWNNEQALVQVMSQDQIKDVEMSNTYLGQKLIGNRKVSGKKQFDNVFKNNKLILFQVQKMRGNMGNLKIYTNQRFFQHRERDEDSSKVYSNSNTSGHYHQKQRQGQKQKQYENNSLNKNSREKDYSYYQKRDRYKDRDKEGGYNNSYRDNRDNRDKSGQKQKQKQRQKSDKSQSYHKQRDRDSRQYHRQRQRQRERQKQKQKQKQRQRQYSRQDRQGRTIGERDDKRYNRDSRQHNYQNTNQANFNASKINQNYNMSSYNQSALTQTPQTNYPPFFFPPPPPPPVQSFGRTYSQKPQGFWQQSDYNRQRDNYKGYGDYYTGSNVHSHQNSNEGNYNRDGRQIRGDTKQIRGDARQIRDIRDQRDKNSGQYYQKRSSNQSNSYTGKY